MLKTKKIQWLDEDSGKALVYILDNSIKRLDEAEDSIHLKYHFYRGLYVFFMVALIIFLYYFLPIVALILVVVIFTKHSSLVVAKKYELRKKIISAYEQQLEKSKVYGDDYNRLNKDFADPRAKLTIRMYENIFKDRKSRLEKNLKTLKDLEEVSSEVPEKLIY